MHLLGLCHAGSLCCGHAPLSLLLPVDHQQLQRHAQVFLVDQSGSSCKRPIPANRIAALLSDEHLGTGTADVVTPVPLVCDPDGHLERVVA